MIKKNYKKPHHHWFRMMRGTAKIELFIKTDLKILFIKTVEKKEKTRCQMSFLLQIEIVLFVVWRAFCFLSTFMFAVREQKMVEKHVKGKKDERR